MAPCKQSSKSAAVAALLLISAGFGPSAAPAGETAAFEERDATLAEIERLSRHLATLAQEAAVLEAAETIRADNRLHLDIQRIDHRSMLAAGDT